MRGLLLFAALVWTVTCAWWDSAVIYQIYPRSFMDSNGDGIGDLNGIKSKLSFLKETGVDAIWMSPIYKSPMYDFGYDITDYKAIAEEYGTMEDFDSLMTEAQKIGIRIVLDYVPNHTSNESEWFIKSAENDTNYIDYYIWANPKVDPTNPLNLLPPNNWVSLFRKSAWEYSTVRKQYYLHQFVIGQPDLNYRSATVRREMEDVLRFWLDKGVSGFRIDAVNMLYEVDAANYGGVYPDEPLAVDAASYTPDDYNYLDHLYTRDLDDTYTVVYDWRAVLDDYTVKANESKVMLTEGYTTIEKMMKYYGSGTRNGSIPFNFIFLGELNNQSTAHDMKQVVDKWITFMPNGKVANWVNGNHDNTRLASRFGTDRVDAMNMLALILPGVSITYQGEELGMTDGYLTWAETKDPQACNTDDEINYWKSSRDPEQTPYHWDSSANAGYSTNSSTWLPVASNYKEVNLATQQNATRSHYKFYKDVVALKHTEAGSTGSLETIAVSDDVFLVNRAVTGKSSIVGIINLASTTKSVDLSSIIQITQNLKVAATGVDCTLEKGATVQKSDISMPAHCVLAFESTDTSTGSASVLTASVTYSAIIYLFCYLFI